MDNTIEKEPWYVRYRLYLAGGVLLLAGLIYVIVLASGPSVYALMRTLCNWPR